MNAVPVLSIWDEGSRGTTLQWIVGDLLLAVASGFIRKSALS